MRDKSKIEELKIQQWNGYFLTMSGQNLVLLEANHSVHIEKLTNTEWNLFQPLLDSYPYPCPYAILLAAWLSISEESSLKMIEQAQKEKTFSRLFHSMQSTLNRLKKKLARFSLTIIAIVKTGYLLIADPSTVFDEYRKQSSSKGALHESRHSFFFRESASS